ncbi:hypothetical protein GCM10028777_20490 [Angustibacter speluncae]
MGGQALPGVVDDVEVLLEREAGRHGAIVPQSRSAAHPLHRRAGRVYGGEPAAGPGPGHDRGGTG